MSITVHLYYTGENGSAKAFAEEMENSGIADTIRAESGNEKYEYYVSFSNPETILLVDRWKDQTALDKHHQSPMMKEIARLRSKYHLHIKAERYTDDSQGIPESDKKFIKE